MEQLLSIVPSAIFTVDLNKKVTSWNKMAETITGYTPDEMIGNECSLFSGEACKSVCGLYEATEKKPLTEKLCTIKAKDGRQIFISKNVDFIYDQSGKIVGGIESFQDITSTKISQIALQKSENKFRLIWENSIDGFRVTDKNAVIRDVNDAFCRMVRKEKEELIGNKLNCVYSNKSDVDILKVYLDRINSTTAVPREEYYLRMWDDRRIWFSVSTISIESDGETLWVSVFRDITESKKTEILHKVIYEISTAVYEYRELYQLLSKIRDIFDQIIDTDNFLVALFDEETGMLSIPFQSNTKEQFMETPMEGTFSGYVIKTKESLLMTEEESYQLVAEGKAKLVGAPAKIWMGVPIKVLGKVYGVIVIQDYEDENRFGYEELNLLEFVSDQIGVAIERIRSREELEKSEKALQISNSTKDKFFSIISHDLKNPFLTLRGYLEILYEDYNDLTEEEIKSHLATLLNVSEKTLNLLQDLLLWSRSQQNNLEIKFEENNPGELINDAIAPLTDFALKKGIKLNTIIESNSNVICDSFTIKTVIRNLVSNAIKFSKSNDTITVKCEESTDKLTFSIKDTGVGIDKETMKNLFILGKASTEKGTLGEEGTGLGLILCKDFLEKHNCELSAGSKLGIGTEFKFELNKVSLEH